jgi:hypothetical protein
MQEIPVKKTKLTNEQLVSIIKAQRAQSLGDMNGDLSAERASSMDHYHGREYGDEQDGRSKVVSRDLSETVEWIMPALMKIFMQSGNIVEFTPVGQEDDQAAQQESDYVNHVIMNDNQGFMVAYDAIKDALLLKNGYFKHSWEESETVKESEYEGLSLEELQGMLQRLQYDGSEVEITGSEEKTVAIETPMGVVQMPTYDVKLRVTCKKGKVCVEAVPPEEVRVSKKCRGSLQDSPFTEHVTRKTRSDLMEMGMARDFVYDAPAYNESNQNSETTSRDSTSDESNSTDGAMIDRSMEEVEYCEAYLRVDYDGDGIAELRKIVTVGNKIPPGDEYNEPMDSVPMTGMVSKRVPHRHIGESLDDELEDLQRIKTVLTRQLLDNIYGTNNQEIIINERAHLPDFLVSLPNGVKRMKGDQPITGDVMPLMRQPIIDQILPALDYVDSIKENRTGINRSTTGLDPDVLKQSTKGAFMENINRASQKVEMIARMLAETGFRELAKRVHELVLKHQDKGKVARLRGKYVTVNPQEWRDRTDMVVKVGLGTGTGEEKRSNLMLLSGLQDRLMPMGLVGEKEAYALFTDMAETIGINLPEKYAINPDPQNERFQEVMKQRQGEQPNPLAEAEKVKGEMMLQREQMNIQLKAHLDMQSKQHEQSQALMQQRLDYANAEADRRSREAIATMQAEIKALMEGYKVDIGKPGIGAELQ